MYLRYPLNGNNDTVEKIFVLLQRYVYHCLIKELRIMRFYNKSWDSVIKVKNLIEVYCHIFMSWACRTFLRLYEFRSTFKLLIHRKISNFWYIEKLVTSDSQLLRTEWSHNSIFGILEYFFWYFYSGYRITDYGL